MSEIEYIVGKCEKAKTVTTLLQFCDEHTCSYECAHLTFAEGLACYVETYKRVVIEGLDEFKRPNPRLGRIVKKQ